MTCVLRKTPYVIRQPKPRWHLTASALIGRETNGRIAYGRWDKQFGAWIEQDGEWLAFSPAVPLFDYRGVWLDPEGELTDAWFEERAMKAAYFSLIPTFIRRKASSCGRCHWQHLQTVWNSTLCPSSTDEGQRSKR
jgi:hypothetical protein